MKPSDEEIHRVFAWLDKENPLVIAEQAIAKLLVGKRYRFLDIETNLTHSLFTLWTKTVMLGVWNHSLGAGKATTDKVATREKLETPCT